MKHLADISFFESLGHSQNTVFNAGYPRVYMSDSGERARNILIARKQIQKARKTQKRLGAVLGFFASLGIPAGIYASLDLKSRHPDVNIPVIGADANEAINITGSNVASWLDKKFGRVQKGKYDQLNEQLAFGKTIHRINAQQIADLENTRNLLSQQLDAAEKDLLEKTQQATRLGATNVMLETSLAEEQSKVSNLTAELNNVQKELENLTADYEQQGQQLKNTEEALGSTSKQLEDTQAKLEFSQQDAADARIGRVQDFQAEQYRRRPSLKYGPKSSSIPARREMDRRMQESREAPANAVRAVARQIPNSPVSKGALATGAGAALAAGVAKLLGRRRKKS